MLDVHIAVSADTRPDWVAQCRESVAAAADRANRAGYPVVVHVVDGVPGHIGNTRAAGFARGSQPFVTYVDDDDYVMPEAFVRIAPALAGNPRLLFTREQRLQNGKSAGIGVRHHLAVMRREDATAHDWPNHPSGGEGALYAKLGAFVQLPDVVYTHRVYRSKGRALRAKHSG